MNREIPALPKMGFQIVDVRDVAQAHLQAMLTPKAAGKRIIVSSGFVWLSELAKILAEEFGPQGYKIPQKTIPHFLVRLFSLFDQETRSVLNELGVKRELNNARMQNLLGIRPIATKDAILATAHTLISKGLINGTPQKK